MPEEYVYKIVVDDGSVNKTIDTIDQKVVALTQRMDAMFKQVGAGAGPAAQQTAQQMEQAAGRVQRAEQQTVQQTVRGQQQIQQARQRSFSTVARELAAADQRVRAAQREADEKKKALADVTRAHIQAQREQSRAQSRVEGLRSAGAEPGRIRDAELVASSRGRRASTISQAREGAKEQFSGAQAELEQAQEAYGQIAQERQNLQAQVTQTAQDQQAAETAASQGTSAAAQEAAQAQLAASRQAVQGSRAIVQGRQQELATATQAAQAARADATAAESVATTKRRASRDAAQAARTASRQATQAAKEVAAAEKEGSAASIEAAKGKAQFSKAAAEARQEEADAAKSASNEAADAAEDAGKRATSLEKEQAEAKKRVTAASQQQGAAERRLGQDTRQLASAKKTAVKAERDAERSFLRTTKTYGKQRNELDALARKHGSFNVVIGKSRSQMNALEKEVDDIIRSDKQLGREIEKLIAKQKRFNVTVDRATFRGGPAQGIQSQTFRQAGFAAQRVGIPGAAALGEAAAVAGPAGIAIAATLLAGQQLVKMFMRLAGAAKEAFEAIVRGSIDAAKEIEVARAQFSAFFQGDTIAAEAALGRLQKLSRELGENVVGVGRAFLPEVENLEQLEQITEIAVALARFQPEQGILGARIALQELLAGETRSLQRRFEINPVAIDQIREAFDTGGVTGLLDELQGELERTGRSVDDLSDTFSVSIGRIQQRWTQLLQTMGDPIITEIKDQLGDVDRELQILSPDLDKIASAFGEVVAKLGEMIGVQVEEFLRDFDPEPLLDVAEALFGVVYAFETWLIGMNAGESAASGLDNMLDGLGDTLFKIEMAFLNAALGMAEYKEQMKGLVPFMEIMNSINEEFVRLPQRAIENFSPGDPALEALAGMPADFIKTLGDFQEGFFEGGGSPEEVQERIDNRNAEVAAFAAGIREPFNSGASGGERQANVFLEMASNLDALIVLQKQYADIQLKVNEAVNEFNIQAQLKFEKLLTDATRKRLDFEIEAAQKTIDIERKNTQKIYDIRVANDQAILDAAEDLTDKEADILRKHSDAVIDLEDDLNDKRLEEEEKYQEELERIRDRFNFQAFEAILANDGKKLRQIRRQQAFEEEQAKKTRDNNLDDIDDELIDRQEKLAIALERELRDARIANARKIRDLAEALEEQLAKQVEARRRDLENQAIAERRKREELKNSLNDQLEDYRTWWDERSRVTTEKISDDLEQLRAWVAEAATIMQDLQGLGISFDPATGMPQMNFQQPAIQEQETPLIEHLREWLVELQQTDEMARFGRTRPEETITAEVEGLSIERLVERIDQLQTELNAAEVFPDQFIDTQGLAYGALFDQALFLGRQVGQGAEEIIDQVLGLSMKDLSTWIDEFIAQYAVHQLPEFSLFGPEFVPEEPGEEPEEPVIPWEGLPGFTGLPPDQTTTAQPAAEEVTDVSDSTGLVRGVPIVQYPTTYTPAPTPASDPRFGLATSDQDVDTANFTQNATTFVENLDQIFQTYLPFVAAGETSAGAAPGAVPGQPQYVFPNVAAPPYLPAGEDTPLQPVVPSFAQAVSVPEQMADLAFMPGMTMPADPAAGFDAEQFQADIDANVAAFVIGEMVKRGEVTDTTAFIDLMIEKQTLGINAHLGAQTDEYQLMSDEQIAILERTLAIQQEALEKLREDPALEEEAKATEEAVMRLEDVLERQREMAAEANLAILATEASAIEDSEAEKQEAIGQTLTVSEQVAEGKKQVTTSGADAETTALQDAANEQAGIYQEGERTQKQIRDEGREDELEAEEEHAEIRFDQLETNFGAEAGILGDFWDNWTQLESQGATQDLRIIAAWIDERNKLIGQIPTLPGELVTLTEGSDDDTGGGADGGGQATLEELQNLATSYAYQLGYSQEVVTDILNMTYGELTEFIEFMQNELAGRALGGSLQPGQASVVGELGPEIVAPLGGAQVYPLRDLLFRTAPAGGAGGGTTINRNMEVTNTFPDPRGIPASYIRMMENIAVKVNRRSWSGS